MSIRTIPFSVVGESEKLAEAELLADAYLPDGGGPAPAVICIHGGGWKAGSRSTYKLIGPLLAARGYAAFSIDYRLVKGEQNLYPAAVDDVRNALRYVREHAAELNVDPDRIALMGDSAGGHLAALVGLTEKPAVAAVIGVFGVYDLAAQWEHDLPARPNDNIAALFLGKPLTEDRHLYFEASPLSHVIAKNAGPAFFLAWGTHDDIVAPAQSEAFLLALKQANFYVRTVVQDAPHFWVGEPLDEPGSYSAFFAARMLRFLDERFPRG